MNKKILFFLFLILLLVGCSSQKTPTGKVINIPNKQVKDIGSSFNIKEDAKICTENGKPIIRLFSTTGCPHCTWIKDTYFKTVQEYVKEDKIVAHLWMLDTGNDFLTIGPELVVPQSERSVFEEFNPKGSIPTFVFGCKYHRVGNAFERQGDLEAEEKEFKYTIDKLIEEAK